MKKTVYFKKKVSWNMVEGGCDDVINQRDQFLATYEPKITKVESEDLRVDFVGNNSGICILRVTYLEE